MLVIYEGVIYSVVQAILSNVVETYFIELNISIFALRPTIVISHL